MTKLENRTSEDLAELLGLAASKEGESGERRPAHSGIASMIRREMHRRSVATRRELCAAVTSYLEAAGYGDADPTVIEIADRMAMLGDLAAIRLEHQRGYAARQLRCVRLENGLSILLGTGDLGQVPSDSKPPSRIVRRFEAGDALDQAVATCDVPVVTLADWMGPPDWLAFLDATESTPIADLWDEYVNRLMRDGAPFDVADTRILAVRKEPGSYFGQPYAPEGSRWVKPSRLDDGTYLAAQPGYGERHWRPLLIMIEDSRGRSLLLTGKRSSRGGSQTPGGSSEGWDLHRWLLLAQSASSGWAEKLTVSANAQEFSFTFPVPMQMARVAELLADRCGAWRYEASDGQDVARLFSEVFEGVEICGV